MSTFLSILGAFVGVGLFILAAIQLRKVVTDAKESDRDKAAARVTAQIDKAVAERDQQHAQAMSIERQQCKDRVQVVVDQLREMTTDRNSERDQRISLQQYINQTHGRG